MAFEMKQSTIPEEAATELEQPFEGIRPHLVVDENNTNAVLPLETQTEHTLRAIASVDVIMSNKLGITVPVSCFPMGIQLQLWRARIPASL